MIAETIHKCCNYGFSPMVAKLSWSKLVNKRNAYIEHLREL